MQSRDAQVLAGMGQVNLMDFVMSLAYPHLNKKAEDRDGSYAIHLTFFCIAFFHSLHSMGSNYGWYFQWEVSQL